MKRTRAATKAASTPAAEAAPVKPAARHVKSKLEKQPKAPSKAAASNAKPKAAEPKAAAKAGGKALKQTKLMRPEANHTTNEPQSQPAIVQQNSAKAAAVEPAPTGVGKRAKRPPPEAAPAAMNKAAKAGEAATPSKAATKDANPSKPAAKAAAHSKGSAEAATPRKAAAKATMPGKAAAKAANPSKAGSKNATTAGQTAAKEVNSPGKHATKTSAAKPLSAPKRELFDHYRQEDDEDVIGPEGVERLCSDMDLSPEDRKVLLLAWKTGAKRMGFFSRDEFRKGISALGAKTVAALKQALPSLEAMVAANGAAAQDFYQFAFRYCLMDGQKKFVEAETAAQMLGVVMPDGPLTARLQEFLAEQTEYKVISADQWLGMYRFSQEVKPDFSNFDESQAWPVLLDNFVDWGRERLAQQETGGQ